VTEPRDAPARPTDDGSSTPPSADRDATNAPGDGPAGTAPEAELRTFLIADIRGYTVYTTEQGADAAAELAKRFAAIVRDVVVAHDGFLLELRGDEALAVFVLARRALRAALELQVRFGAELPRGVGIGLDAGEAIPVEGGYRGSALNLAARLCGQAGPGETLASEAVIHLAAKVDGIGYADPRTYRLKGMDEPIRAVHVVPADRGSKKPIRYGRDSGSDRRLLTGVGLALVAVAVVAAGLSGAFGLIGSGGRSPVPTGTSALSVSTPSGSAGTFALADLPLLAFYDAKTGSLEDTRAVRSPRSVAAFADGSFWQVLADPKSIDEIDPATHRVLRSFAIPVAQERGFNFSPEALWFTDLDAPRVVRVDRASGVVTPFPIGKDANDQAQTFDIAIGAGSVWFSRPDAGEIVRMDPTTGRIQARIGDVDAYAIDFGDGAVWYSGDGRVGRIDPITNIASKPIDVAPGTALSNMAFAGGYGWVTEASEGNLYKVDRTGLKEVIKVRPGIGTPAATSGAVWLSNNRDGTLTRVDAITSETRTIDTGHATLAIAAGEDQLMVAVGPTADEVIGELPGSILTLTTEDFPWDDPSPDPPNNWNLQARQAEYLTCLGLLAYPDKPAPDGFALRPDAAVAMPIVSADGRTYTFTIRPGLAFSPPSNAPITAETFRSTIERALSPKLVDWAPGPQFLSDIVGAEAYRQGKVSSIQGLSVAGDELRITLVARSEDFLERLALPFYCAVPDGTPAAPQGLDPSPPVAGGGPYYYADKIRLRLVVLKKNPNYHGDRPQPFDAIAIKLRSSPSDLLAAVKNHTVDAAMLLPGETLVGAGGPIEQAWGPSSDAGKRGDQRWFGAARPQVSFLSLNPGRPAFKDPAVRRAVALALDRTALARISARPPLAGLIAPAFAGVAKSDVPEPDPAAARALLRGRTFTVTMATLTEGQCDTCDALANEVQGELQAIGITVHLQRSDDPWGDALKRGSKIDLFEAGRWSDIPDFGSLIQGLGDASWIGPELVREVERVGTLGGQARLDAATSLARKVVDDDVLIIPYAYDIYSTLLSDQVGCAFVQPAIGAVDLLSLCIKDGRGGSSASPAPSVSPAP
jgi:ABC-type transport system substrate-binding protein/class 3 adenylate cyclase